MAIAIRVSACFFSNFTSHSLRLPGTPARPAHGLGFAGGLQEIGIPEHAAAWALVGFGIGVELGQVAFLLLLVGLLQLFARHRLLRPAALGATYIAGGLSAYWLFERVLGSLIAPGR